MRGLHAAVLVLVLGIASVAQELPPSPFDGVVTVQFGEPFEVTADFSGSLFVWPAWRPGDPPLVLTVGDTTDDGGGVHTPCIRSAVVEGQTLAIRVTGARGPVALHWLAAPETDATRAAAASARDAITEIARLRAAGELDAARERLASHVGALLAVPGGDHSEAAMRALQAFGDEADALALLSIVEQTRRTALEHRLRVLPDDHPDVTAARQSLAVALYRLGDLRGAAALNETVLAARTRTLPEDHPDLLEARANFAATLDALGDLRGALALFEQVLAARVRARPDDPLVLADARESVGVLRFRLGDLHGARALLDQVLEVRARTLPDDHPDLASVRSNLSVVLRGLGDLPGARSLQEQVVATRTRTLPEDHLDLARARGNLASTLKALGDLRGARALEEQVLAVFSRTLPDEHPNVTTARSNLAATRKLLGDLAGARVLQEQVLAVRARTLPEDHPDLLIAQQNLAVTLGALGDPEAERALQEHTLAVRVRTLPEDHPDLAFARENLAGTLKTLGDLHGARVLFEQALAVRTRNLPENHPDLASTRANLAVVLASLGDLQGARVLQEQALAAFSRTLPDDHPDLAWARQSLAITLGNLGDVEGARDLLEETLAGLSRTLPEDHPALAAARQNLALALETLGDPRAARVLEERALASLSRTLPDDHPDLASARSALASTLLALGDLHGARTLAEQVLSVRERTLPDDHPDLAVARRELAVTFAVERARQRTEGLEAGFQPLALAYCRSLGRVSRAAWLEGSTREVEERAARAAKQVGTALSLAHGLDVFAADAGSLEAAFLASECTRGAARIASSLVRTAREHPRYEALRAAVAAARADVARAVLEGTERATLERALARREAAEKELLAVATEAGASAALADAPAVATLAAVLDSGQAAVAYLRYRRTAVDAAGRNDGDAFCAFVLRPGGRLACVVLGPAAPVEAAVGRWRAGSGPDAGRGLAAAPAKPQDVVLDDGDAIRRLVWDPLLPVLAGDRRVVLVADDVLNTVPFDALPYANGEVLGDRFEIQPRLTLTELLLSRAAPAERAAGGIVALGDPAFGAAEDPVDAVSMRGLPSDGGFAPLPATGAEARGIAALSGQAVLLTGSRASLDTVAASAPRARFLHLATHGWFAPESILSFADGADPNIVDAKLGLVGQSVEERLIGSSPMVLCGLALAGANLPPDALGRNPGLVTAEEIAGWDLSNCELAVLSACDTNVGLRRAGQGVASLQKALHMAGARSVITSLWKVPDEATKDLMLDFYRRLWVEKKPKRQALWEAKMRLRDTKDETGAPLYSTRDWAAWVLTGDPE